MDADEAQTPFGPFAGNGFGHRRAQQVGPQLGKEGECRHDEGHVAVPGVPGSRLAMVEAEVAVGRLETGLDCPPQPGDAASSARLTSAGANTT